jgi:uncharacterized membrane protein YciS (DUF1049 family)
MVKTIKNFGELCAVESVVAFTFLVTVALCLHEGELIAALVAFGIAAGAVVLGVVRFKIIKEKEARRNETLPTSEQVATLDTKPKRNRAKPAPAKPRKVVKKGKARK